MQRRCMHCMAEIGGEVLRCPHCNTSQVMDIPVHRLLPGSILNKRYFVGEALGEGGFGITYIGYDNLFDRKVAIKEYFPKSFVERNNTSSPTVYKNITEDRQAFVERGLKKFLDEAKVLAKFQDNPGIVSVYDFFEENGTAYIVMQYLHGVTLKKYIEKNGCIPAKNMIPLMMPVMETLDEIHKNNLIHRDISPDNIMFVEGNTNIKLLDFGAARDYSAQDGVSMSIMLKPGYAPEEQYRRRGKQGPWTDVYALCATMYKCITGVRPEEATDRVAEDDIKTISELGVEIDKNAERVIMKGLSVYAKDRYSSITELLTDLKSECVDEEKEEVKTDPVVEEEPVIEAEPEYTVAVGQDIIEESPVPAETAEQDEQITSTDTEVEEEDITPEETTAEELSKKKKIIEKIKKINVKTAIIAGIAVIIAAASVFTVSKYNQNGGVWGAENIIKLEKGYKAVKKNGLWGMVDNKKKQVLPFEYEYIDKIMCQDFDGNVIENSGFIRIQTEEGWGMCDYDGNILFSPKYSAISIQGDFVSVQTEEGFGLCDYEGNVIVPAKYSAYYSYDEKNQLFEVSCQDEHNGRRYIYGVYNSDGKVIVPVEYDIVFDVENRCIPVKTFDEKFGMYNLDGELIIPIEYKHVSYRGDEAWEVTTFDDKDGVYNSNGDIIIPIGYYEYLFWEENLKVWTAKTADGIYGVLNSKCEVVIPFEYEYLRWMEEEKLWDVTTPDGRSGAYNSDGEIIDPIE